MRRHCSHIRRFNWHGSQGKKVAYYLSVEHMWAAENRNVQGENNRAIDWFEKRRLGNFVLLELRLNIQASNTSLEENLVHYMGRGDEPQTICSRRI